MARLLRMRLIPEESMAQVSRMISYEFMNRQLVWTGFTVCPHLPSHRHQLT
jgi:hypothetical protein